MICKTSDGLSLYYEVIGNTQSDKTLVFLNGLTQSTVSWGLVTPFFVTDYKIILVDFIFQGQSDKVGDWRTFDTHAQDLLSVLTQLQISNPIVIGISYGSIVAQHFAVNYQNKLSKLILLSTFAHKTAYYNAIELSWWRALELGGYSLMFDIMLPSVLSEAYFKNPLIPIELMKQTRLDANYDAKAIFKLMQATKERNDYRAELQAISVPTLVIQGEKDVLFPTHLAHDVSKAILNSKFKIIPHVGHTLNLEAVSQIVTLIKEFI